MNELGLVLDRGWLAKSGFVLRGKTKGLLVTSILQLLDALINPTPVGNCTLLPAGPVGSPPWDLAQCVKTCS